ncbi:hypothetical protein Tco_0680281 [Tanacetum coccineum]|uniref:Uncharacterized protein n=1 Tax=Tanacetum coccineum TaxID=301880 RepID=A0ABQ4XK61_9ASTR
MEVRDMQHFDQILQINAAHRLSGFSCQATNRWQCTLDHWTSLVSKKKHNIIPSEKTPDQNTDQLLGDDDIVLSSAFSSKIGVRKLEIGCEEFLESLTDVFFVQREPFRAHLSSISCVYVAIGEINEFDYYSKLSLALDAIDK